MGVAMHSLLGVKVKLNAGLELIGRSFVAGRGR